MDDPISGRYTLEVSSPGIDRPLFTPDQFARFLGEQVKLTVSLPVNGRKRFQGRLAAVEGTALTLALEDGTSIVLDHANVQAARLVPDYVALGLAPAKKPSGGTAGKAKKKA